MPEMKTRFTVDPKVPSVAMTREFSAPRRMVFDAMTKPEHVKQWYGPRSVETTRCEIDLRPGGAYRIVLRSADGQESGFKGEYREIVAPERIVYTWIYEGMPDKGTLVTDVYTERAGKTVLTSTTLFESFEDRDGFLKTGAEEGANESMERLAELLATLA